jgi:hypothetical protein
MKLPRLTIRRLMIVVAVVAMIFGTGIWMYRRSVNFRAIADDHQRRLLDLPLSKQQVSWHLDLIEKYRFAEHYPWLPVPPDPPEPE